MQLFKIYKAISIYVCFFEVHIPVAFGFKSQGTEEIEFFSQGIDDFINLRYESLITITNYKCKEIPDEFCFLACEIMAEKR